MLFCSSTAISFTHFLILQLHGLPRLSFCYFLLLFRFSFLLGVLSLSCSGINRLSFFTIIPASFFSFTDLFFPYVSTFPSIVILLYLLSFSFVFLLSPASASPLYSEIILLYNISFLFSLLLKFSRRTLRSLLFCIYFSTSSCGSPFSGGRDCFIKVNRPSIDATRRLLLLLDGGGGLLLNYPFYLPPPPLAPLYPATIRYPRSLLCQACPPDQPLVSGSMVPVGWSPCSLISRFPLTLLSSLLSSLPPSMTSMIY